MSVYVSIIETEEGAFQHIARPGQQAEDIPLAIEGLVSLAADASAAARNKVQAAKATRASRVAAWNERDARAG